MMGRQSDLASSTLSQLSSDKLLAGVELNDGAVESACKVLGDEGFED